MTEDEKIEASAKIAISTTNQKLTYALGAGCGAICGLIILQLNLF